MSEATNLEALEMALFPGFGCFCRRHFSWLCGLARGQCQRDYIKARASSLTNESK